MNHTFKIINNKLISRSFFLLSLMIAVSINAYAQINIISDWKTYKVHLQSHKEQALSSIPINAETQIQYNPVYASKYNFTGVILYKKAAHPYLNSAAVQALLQLNEHLHSEGLGILIWDAYRPHAATQKMWDVVGDERYVANPKTGSGHNKGLAIDLTLYNLSSGKIVEMGTDFDNLTDSADHSFKGISAEAIANRKLLRSKMESVGFRAYEAEWWHYSWPGTKDWPVYNLSFAQLKRKIKK